MPRAPSSWRPDPYKAPSENVSFLKAQEEALGLQVYSLMAQKPTRTAVPSVTFPPSHSWLVAQAGHEQARPPALHSRAFSAVALCRPRGPLQALCTA